MDQVLFYDYQHFRFVPFLPTFSIQEKDKKTIEQIHKLSIICLCIKLTDLTLGLILADVFILVGGYFWAVNGRYGLFILDVFWWILFLSLIPTWMHIDKIIAKQVLSIEKYNADYTKKYVNYYFHIVKIWWKRALYAYWFTGSGTFTDVYLAKWTAQLLKSPPISAQENWNKQKAWLEAFGNSRWFNQNVFAHLKEELEANKPASSDVQINVSPLNTDLNFNKDCITPELAFNSQILNKQNFKITNTEFKQFIQLKSWTIASIGLRIISIIFFIVSFVISTFASWPLTSTSFIALAVICAIFWVITLSSWISAIFIDKKLMKLIFPIQKYFLNQKIALTSYINAINDHNEMNLAIYLIFSANLHANFNLIFLIQRIKKNYFIDNKK